MAHQSSTLSQELQPEAQVLLRATSARLFDRPDPDLPALLHGSFDWFAFSELARETRLLGLALEGLRHQGLAPPPPHVQRLKAYQIQLLHLNSRNLATIRAVLPRFRERNIEVVVLKGPFGQSMALGSAFLKPATDVDLLVAKHDYDAAATLLRDAGFGLTQRCNNIWWSYFLGEQQFKSEDEALLPIDLHSRVQQPGCPQPTSTSDFLNGVIVSQIGGVEAPSPSWVNACLLSAMNVTKHLVGREPAAAHAADLCGLLNAQNKPQIEELFEAAQARGLAATLALALRCAHALFGSPQTMTPKSVPLASTSDTTIRQMALTPHASSIRRPGRSQILWDLCDQHSQFGAELTWRLASEACRSILGRQAISAPRPITRLWCDWAIFAGTNTRRT